MADVAQQVMALEAACHRALRNPEDEASRASLLEALASYKAVPVGHFPSPVQGMVAASRDQADALCVRILEITSGAAHSMDRELREMCHTLASLAATLNEGADAAVGRMHQHESAKEGTNS
jgi:hypothetical protein